MQTAKAIMMQAWDTDFDRNPSPKAHSKAAERKRRGRLKIFLGAAPGVGTTCEMIRAGITKHRERVDVVVGVVETHGRKETEVLLKELESIPSHAFNCRRVCEMDLDVVLARRPELVLVDELAHRFMDVRELLRVMPRLGWAAVRTPPMPYRLLKLAEAHAHISQITT